MEVRRLICYDRCIKCVTAIKREGAAVKKIFDRERFTELWKKNHVSDVLGPDSQDFLELFFFRKDEYVLYEGLHSDHLYFLAQGQVRIYSSIGNGKSFDHGYFPFFRVIGEASCLWGEPASASVQCTEDSYLFALSLKKNRDYCMNNVAFLRYICNILRAQMWEQKQGRNTLFFPLEQRLASLLLQNNSNGMLERKITECADMLCSSYRHVLRLLDSFCRRGLVNKCGHGKYRIADEQQLEQIASKIYLN